MGKYTILLNKEGMTKVIIPMDEMHTVHYLFFQSHFGNIKHTPERQVTLWIQLPQVSNAVKLL